MTAADCELHHFVGHDPKPQPVPDVVTNDFAFDCGNDGGSCTTYFNRRKTKAMYDDSQSYSNYKSVVRAEAGQRTCTAAFAAIGAAGGMVAGPPTAMGAAAVAGALANNYCSELANEKAALYADDLEAAAKANQCFAVRSPSKLESGALGLIPVIGKPAGWVEEHLMKLLTEDTMVRSTTGLCLD